VHVTACDLEKSFTFDNKFKSQATFTFLFMCKHTVVKRPIFPELWVLQKVKTAKVTFSLTLIGQSVAMATYLEQLQNG